MLTLFSPQRVQDMKTIDIFYQGNGIHAIEHLEIDESQTFSYLKKIIIKTHNLQEDAFIFLEDDEIPVDENLIVSNKAGRAGIKVHIHRCREIRVVVHFKDKTIHHNFSPSTTVARVKNWAAEKKFKMSEEEASHHHLQIAGTTEQPNPGTHIGTLTSCPKCTVEFDLVSTPKVNGAN